jgi:TetR/AcrR family transcriptional repressor of nem operon
MVRYRPEHKQATRERIVTSAGRRLKTAGIDGAGLSGLMADAGLTNGAFYAHFGSKDELVATVVRAQLAAQRDTIAALPDDPAALVGYIREYLSPAHRDSPADGCPSAALLLDISRAGQMVREAYAAGIEEIVDVVAARLGDRAPAEARGIASGLITMLVGALQLARALPDEATSTRVLDDGFANAQRLLR